MGVPEPLLEPGRIGLQIMTPWTIMIAWRRLNQGLMIKFGDSKSVAMGTVVRLVSLVSVLSIGKWFTSFSGIFLSYFRVIFFLLIINDVFMYNFSDWFKLKLISVRETFDKYNLISALHRFMKVEDKKYKNLLPPLVLLTQEKQKELLSKLNSLDFMPNKGIAA